MEINISSWGMFWLFMIVYAGISAWQFDKGYDTGIWEHKTDAEKEIQKIKIDNMRKDTENV
jgi:hypothetical protein